ncbi:DNA polymerase Y family protein, partial [Roseococcus sp. DSY-14]
MTHGHDGRREVVAAACRAALALGLRPGLPLAEARARIPDLAVAPADLEGDAAALRDLAAWALRWTPLVAPDAPDGLLLDVTGAAALHGGEAALPPRLVRALRGAGLAARAAV